jgi:hypothetical protein
VSFRPLLARRDTRLLLAGQTVSLFGDSALFLVLGIWAKALTGSNAAAGLVFFVLVLGTLGAPITGLLVDRVPKRPLLIAGYVGMAVALLPLLLVHGRGDVWLIYAVAVAYGLGLGLFGSARSALLKTMLPEEVLVDANAALSTVREGLRLIAPLAGAGLFAAFGGSLVALLDAASFLVAAATLVAMRVDEPAPARYEHRLRTEFVVGLRHIRRTLPLLQLVSATGVALLVVGFAETIVFAVIDPGLHRPPSVFGILGACQGVGAIAGGVTAGAALRRYGDGALVGGGLALFALGELLWIFPHVATVATGEAIAGAGVAWAVVGFVTAVQLRSPLPIVGRVSSAAELSIGTPQAVGIAVGAGLSTLVDYRLLIVVMSAVTAACAAYLLTRRTFVPRAERAVLTAGS